MFVGRVFINFMIECGGIKKKKEKKKEIQKVVNSQNKYWVNRAFGRMCRVFANGPGDRGSIPGRVVPKTQKMVLDAAFLNTQHYKVSIMGKVEQSR